MIPVLEGIVAIPLSQNLFVRLARRYPEGVVGVVEHVLEDFLDRTKEDFQSAEGTAFLWDQLRLPTGTKVRTKYYGTYQVGEVENGKLYWDGEEYSSMSRLARAMRGNTSNNAWVVMELQFPGEATWTLADRLRK